MAFRSTLQPILRLRKLIEENKELALRLAQLRFSSCTRDCTAAEDARTQVHAAISNIQHPTPAIELHFLASRQVAIAEKIRRLRRQVEDARVHAAAERNEYNLARRQRKQVEILYEIQQARWREKLAHAEQRAVDEMFLMNWQRTRQDLQGAGTETPSSESHASDGF